MTASIGIGQLYHKSQFTNPSENEDEAYTITGLNDRTIIETIRKQEKLLKNGDVIYQMVRPYQKNNLFFNNIILNCIISHILC